MAQVTQPASIQQQLNRNKQPHPLYVLRWRLFILFFPLAGPFLAPLFARIGIWPFGMIAQFVYFLGNTLCPIPDRAPQMMSYSTAVCPLCYGALLGLTAILLSFPFRPTVRRVWEQVPWALQLTLITAALVPWLSDYVINKTGIGFTADWAMYLIGIPGGLAVGLLSYFVLGKPSATA